jgi:hypothetical protein
VDEERFAELEDKVAKLAMGLGFDENASMPPFAGDGGR